MYFQNAEFWEQTVTNDEVTNRLKEKVPMDNLTRRLDQKRHFVKKIYNKALCRWGHVISGTGEMMKYNPEGLVLSLVF